MYPGLVSCPYIPLLITFIINLVSCHFVTAFSSCSIIIIVTIRVLYINSNYQRVRHNLEYNLYNVIGIAIYYGRFALYIQLAGQTVISLFNKNHDNLVQQV